MLSFFNTYKRPVAILTLGVFLTQLFTPTVAYALTAGPTSPEATSFEPIDTTDMVNLATGDFTYNIPLLEVPGPEGGFPISMSYHADIQPNEEASWVGLGWSLNTGAITRTINGYPDDAFETSGTRRDYWSGGSRTDISIGVVIGPAGAAGASFGLTFSNDTYKGFGMGGYVGVTAMIPGSTSALGAGVDAKIGGNPYDAGSYAEVGAFGSVGIGDGLSLGGSVGLSTNFETVSGYAGAGLSQNITGLGKNGDKSMSGSLLGISMSSNSSSPSVRVAGAGASQTNGNSGRVSYSSSGGGLTIPTPWGFGVSLGFNTTRYWIDETENVKGIGTLHTNTLNNRILNVEQGIADYAYDSYDMPEINKTQDIEEQGNAAKHAGGSFADYDSYSVQAQGLGGQIQPYILQHTHTFKQNVREKDDNNNWAEVLTYFNKPNTDKKIQFRFAGEYANNFKENQEATISYGDRIHNMSYNPASMQAGGEYNTQNNQLAGTKHIEWFTNQEIRNGEAKNKGLITDKAYTSYEQTRYITYKLIDGNNDKMFLNYHLGGGIRSLEFSKLIGAFKITNESGLTYHFSLAAYNYGTFNKTKKDTPASGKTFTQQQNPNASAYTWYLTAITAPDFVDRNNDGMANEGDWGYWTIFNYGKWTDQYLWRNPAEGTHKDFDTEYENFSYGYKEVYYLNSISNRDNSILFVKSLRADAKSVSNEKDGGSNIEKREEFIARATVGNPYFYTSVGYFNSYPTSSLKLDAMYLLSNKDYKNLPNNITNLGNNQTNLVHFGCYLNSEVVCNPTQNFNNIIDTKDIEVIKDDLKKATIRSINFKYNYNLCPETPNSFDPNGEIYVQNVGDLTNPTNPIVQNMNNKLGKLTLNSIEFFGKGGQVSPNTIPLIPPINFKYDLEDPTQKTASIGYSNGKHQAILPNFKAGDLAKFTYNNLTYYVCLLAIEGSANTFYLNFIGKNKLEANQSLNNIQFTATKNPPYNRDAIDVWGKYKSDFDVTNNNNYALAHETNKISAISKDVWSLRSIETSLGAKIDISYSSDDYSKTVENTPIITLKNPEYLPDGKFKFLTSSNLTTIFPVPESLKVSLIYSDIYGVNSTNDCKCEFNISTLYIRNMKRIDIQESYIILQDIELYNWLMRKRKKTCYPNRCDSEYEGIGLFRRGITTINNGGIQTFGDGLKVDKIAIKYDNKISTTHYEYQQPFKTNNTFHSSGVTSYEPSYLSDGLNYGDNARDRLLISNGIKAEILRTTQTRILALSREIPPPSVIYEYVSIKQSTQEGTETPIYLPGYSCYRFQTYQKEMVDVEQKVEKQVARIDTKPWFKGRTKIKNNTSSIGKLLSSAVYGENDKLLGEVRYDYADENTLRTQYNSQGIIDQSFSELKMVYKDKEENKGVKSVVSTLTEIPSVLLGTTAVDYTTGITTNNKTLAFDFYTGQPTHTYNKDGFGNEYVSVSVPAYRLQNGTGLQYPEMGLKTVNASNKNMLTQEGESYFYKLYPQNSTQGNINLNIPNLGNVKANLLSASVQTWNNKWAYRELQNGNYTLTDANTDANPVWRKHQSYLWRSATMNEDGTHTNFAPYNWASAMQVEGWQKNGELTLYDRYSHALEAKDLNGNFAATKMGYNQSKVMATGGGIAYTEFAYSGAEDSPIDGYFGGEVQKGSAVRYTAISNTDPNVHTGKYSLRLTPGTPENQGFITKITASTKASHYRISVWVKTNNANNLVLYWKDVYGTTYRSNDANPRSKVTVAGEAGAWTLLNWDIPKLYNNVSYPLAEVGCETVGTEYVYVDDFRVHPLQAPIISYVYDEQYGELSHVLDGSNMYTTYEYDVMGRLKAVHKEVFNKYNSKGKQQVSSHEYNYGRDKQ
jgi:hypothetical protein